MNRNWIVSCLGKKLVRSHPEVLASTWPAMGWHARRASAGWLVAEMFDWRLHLGVKHEKHDIQCETRPAWSLWPQLPPICCTSAAQHTKLGKCVGISPPVFPFPQQKPSLMTSWSSRQISPLASQSRMWVNKNHLCSLPCDRCCRDSSGDSFGGCPVVFGLRQVAQLFPAPVLRLLAGLTWRWVCWMGKFPWRGRGRGSGADQHHPQVLLSSQARLLARVISHGWVTLVSCGCLLILGVNAPLLVWTWRAAAFSALWYGLGPACPARLHLEAVLQ